MSVGAEFTRPQRALHINVASQEYGSGGIVVSGGSGTCANAPGGSMDCEYSYPGGTSITLTAVASPDSTFLGWGPGPCYSVMGPTCTFPLDMDLQFAAGFMGPRHL